MSIYVYERSLNCTSSGRLLKEIRRTVLQLKRSESKLKHSSLANVELKRDETSVNVTLFFQP